MASLTSPPWKPLCLALEDTRFFVHLHSLLLPPSPVAGLCFITSPF